jgi:site-specific DNA recombinase
MPPLTPAAITERAEFEAVAATLKAGDPRVTPPRAVTGPILLTGLATCARRQGRMTLRTSMSKSGQVHRDHSCSTHGRRGRIGCSGRTIRMDRLDAQRLCSEITAAEDRLRRLCAMVEDGVTDLDDILRERLAAPKSDREKAKAALDRVNRVAPPAAAIAPELFERFSMQMRENVAAGAIPAARHTSSRSSIG